MARSGGIPGTAVALATAGGFLIYAGIRDVGIAEGLRELVSGRTPAPGAAVTAVSGVTGGGRTDAGSSSGPVGAGRPAVAAAALRYVGAPYKWGAAGPDRFDCSGLVTWVLAHDLGMTNLPSSRHTTSAQFLVWGGAYTVPRASCSAGDLLCWAGHVAIALDGSRMVEAPGAGKRVRVAPIRSGCAVRRIGARPAGPAVK